MCFHNPIMGPRSEGENLGLGFSGQKGLEYSSNQVFQSLVKNESMNFF